MDVKHARKLGAVPETSGPAFDLEFHAPPPVAAHMRHHGERLLSGSDIIQIAMHLGDLARFLGKELRGAEVAPLPGLVCAQAREPSLLGRIRRHLLSR
jgi:hypothetical protein